MRTVSMGHGAGGALTEEIVRMAREAFSSRALDEALDSAIVPSEGGRLALTTDSYVVKPLFFPGGDIGRLAVCGAVNDLSVVGARPRFLACGLILEEGLPFDSLERVLASMASCSVEAGVEIVAGDTKVVERGRCDGLYLNVSGLGFVPDGLDLSGGSIEAGDALLVSGTLGDHAMTIMSLREELRFESPLRSDAAPLNGLVAGLLGSGARTRFMRDLTRGGLAGALHELADLVGAALEIDEDAIPARSEVLALSDILGVDTLSMANEGKVLAVVAAADAARALAAMRSHSLGAEASIIGRVAARPGGPGGAGPSTATGAEVPGAARVRMRTRAGGLRIVSRPTGERLPRIC